MAEKIYGDKNCDICGAVFTPKTGSVLTCSAACYRKRRNARRNEARAEARARAEKASTETPKPETETPETGKTETPETGDADKAPEPFDPERETARFVKAGYSPEKAREFAGLMAAVPGDGPEADDRKDLRSRIDFLSRQEDFEIRRTKADAEKQKAAYISGRHADVDDVSALTVMLLSAFAEGLNTLSHSHAEVSRRFDLPASKTEKALEWLGGRLRDQVRSLVEEAKKGYERFSKDQAVLRSMENRRSVPGVPRGEVLKPDGKRTTSKKRVVSKRSGRRVPGT